jgi:hypothetical protein
MGNLKLISLSSENSTMKIDESFLNPAINLETFSLERKD